MSDIGKEWRCFHCDEVFTSEADAALHFGSSEIETAACKVDAEKLRELERELWQWREECTPLHNQIAALQSEILTRERRAEEKGYQRGLDDARKHPEELGLQLIL